MYTNLHCELLALEAAHDKFRRWMLGAALPFWLTSGYEGAGRGFVEHLALDATPAPVPFKRVRVQARQVYVYSHAAILGWTDGLSAAKDTLAFATANGWRPQGGWVRSIGREGGIFDDTADLYDAAFMLFACAWHYRATGDSSCVMWAHRTLDWVETSMRAPGQQGFENCLPTENRGLQQNPHMHLLEAALSLYEASHDDRFGSLAAEILNLFKTRLFDQHTGTLAESFDYDWVRLRDQCGAVRIEPGHQFEWTWLLFEAFRLLRVDMRDEARALYRFATQYGVDPSTGLVCDAVDEVGNEYDQSIRVWPQTEAIKAHLAMLEHEGLPTGTNVRRTVENLFSYFLARQPEGTWTEHLTSEGKSKGERIPTSSLYHLYLAYAELQRAINQLRPLVTPSASTVAD